MGIAALYVIQRRKTLYKDIYDRGWGKHQNYHSKPLSEDTTDLDPEDHSDVRGGGLLQEGALKKTPYEFK